MSTASPFTVTVGPLGSASPIRAVARTIATPQPRVCRVINFSFRGSLRSSAGALMGRRTFRAGCFALTQLVQRSLEGTGELLGRACSPVMQKINRRLGAGHVVMNRYHV